MKLIPTEEIVGKNGENLLQFVLHLKRMENAILNLDVNAVLLNIML